jgi:hypothetical protein
VKGVARWPMAVLELPGRHMVARKSSRRRRRPGRGPTTASVKEVLGGARCNFSSTPQRRCFGVFARSVTQLVEGGCFGGLAVAPWLTSTAFGEEQ